MRWAITSTVFLMLISVGFADESQETGRTLTPKQAQEAIQDAAETLSFEHVTSLTPEVAAILAKHKGELSLDGLETLSAEAAGALAKHDGRLSLNGISSLPDDAALALAKHQGDLCMQSLRELYSEPLARQLLLARNSHRVGGDGGLNSDRLTAISPEVAELLVIAEQDRDSLSLAELKSPSPDVLRVLTRLNGDLSLGIASLTPEIARVLAAHSGNLALPAAKEIDKATLAILATKEKEDGLNLFLTAITPEVAMALSGFNGGLTLHAERLTEDVERVLAKSNANLVIPELKEIKTGELARKLVEAAPDFLPANGQRLPLSFEGWQLAVESLSPAVAEEIKAFRGLLMLRACESLPLDVEDILSECEGSVKAPALRELKSVKLARKLAEHTEDVAIAAGTSAFGSSSGLELRNLSEISPDVAGALASHSGEYLLLEGLTALSAETAACLAEFSGNLSLRGVTDLSAEAQRNLGAGKVKVVRLSSLRTLTDPMLAMKIFGGGQLEAITPEVAAILADRFSRRRERSTFGSNPNSCGLGLSLKEITPDIATALAKNIVRDGYLHLDSLQSMDAATASELAKCPGTLYLAGLKQLTPEVAAAFAEKPGFLFVESVEEIPVELAKVLVNKKEGYISFTPNYGKKRETPLKLPNESAELLKDNEHIKLPKQLHP